MPETTTQPDTGFGTINVGGNAPVGPTAWQLSEERLKREQSSTVGDYVRSIWRQDGLADGLMAQYAGSQMTPDENYNPFTAPDVEETEKGIWDDHKHYLYEATSPAHKQYIRDLLLQKQDDLTRLGDMGWKGTVGRFALNAVMPDQLLMAMMGGWVTRGVTAARAVRASRMVASQLGKAEAMAGVAADHAASKAGFSAAAAGIGFGAAENVAYEKLRQKFNFENDNVQLLEAGFMGAAITSPFALAGIRGADRAAAVASREHATLRALVDHENGKALTPEQGKLIHETVKVNEAVHNFQTGKIDADQLEAALDEFHGPHEPAERWMARYGERISDEANALIEANYSSPKERAPKGPNKGEVRAMDEAVDLETKTNFPAKARPDDPLEGAMQAAFKKAVMEREAARKSADLEGLKAEVDALKKAERDAAWQRAEKDREAAKKADHEKAIRERELARMLHEEDPLEAAAKAADHPHEAPVAQPQGNLAEQHLTAIREQRDMEARGANAEGHPEHADYQAAQARTEEVLQKRVDEHEAAGQYVGRYVSWENERGAFEGTVERVGANGNLIVRDMDGEMRSVHPSKIDPTPEGFGPGSVGAAQVKGTTIDSLASQRTFLAEFTIPGSDKKIPMRLDIYSVLNGSPVKRVRELAYKLVKDPIQNDNFEAQGWTASEWKKQLQRTVVGRFHAETSLAFREAAKVAGIKFWQRGKFAEEFYGLVSRVTRGDADVLAANPELAPMLQKAAKSMADGYRTLLSQAKNAGVKGAQDVDFNDFFVNRVWHHGNIRKATLAHGEDSIIKVIAESIQNKAEVLGRLRKSPGMAHLSDAELLNVKAKRFLTAVKSLEHSNALRDITLAGRDMATLRSELDGLGVNKDHVDDLIDLMFEMRPGEADAGRVGNLKFRFGLDENTSVVTHAGELKLADLFENDARVLMDVYSNSMAGHTGLAKVGIPDRATWAAELKRATDEASNSPGIDGGRVAKDMALLEDVYKNITGRPMNNDSFSNTARAAAAFRGYTRAVMLGQLGIAATFEMANAVARLGLGAMLKQMPSLRSILTAFRNGYLPDQGLARDIMLWHGFGYEKMSAYARANEIENGFFGTALTVAEKGANKASHAVDILSGNASITSITRQFAGMMSAQNMADFAHGKTLTEKMQQRWVGQGISAEDIPDVLAAFKKHSSMQGKRLTEIRYEDWLKDSPSTYEKFQLWMSRQVRDAIQDQDLGETMPFMHSTLGKVFAELKTFMLVAHAKNFLKNVHYRDATAVQVWLMGFLGESMAYMLQSSINQPDKLEENLTPDKIARAALFRMAALGGLSYMVDTGYQLATGGESLVQPGMTANTGNRSLLNTPSLIVAKKLGSAPATLSGLLTGSDVTTRTEFKDLWSSAPGSGLIGMRQLGNYFAETFPKSDPEKGRQRPY